MAGSEGVCGLAQVARMMMMHWWQAQTQEAQEEEAEGPKLAAEASLGGEAAGRLSCRLEEGPFWEGFAASWCQ